MKIATGWNTRMENHDTTVREYATIEVTAKKMVQYYTSDNHTGRFVGLLVKLTVPETTPFDAAAVDDTKKIKAVVAAAESKKRHKRVYELYEKTDMSKKRKLELDEKERAEKVETIKAEARKMRGVVHRSLCCSFLDALNYLYRNGFVIHESIGPKFFQFSRIVENHHDKQEQEDDANAMLLENQASEKNGSDSLASPEDGVSLEFAGVHFDQSYDTNRCWIIKEAKTKRNAVLFEPEYEPNELLSCKTNCEIFYEFEVSHYIEWLRQRGYERRMIHRELEEQFRSVLRQHTSLDFMLFSRVRKTGMA